MPFTPNYIFHVQVTLPVYTILGANTLLHHHSCECKNQLVPWLLVQAPDVLPSSTRHKPALRGTNRFAWI